MLRTILFSLLLCAALGYAFWRGQREERLVAAICVAAALLSLLLVGTISASYSTVELGVLLVDLAVLATFTTVALQSDRFWPLWVSGLQLTTSVGHLLKAVNPDLLPLAYAAALRFWSYPILVILLVATWRSHQRRLQELPSS
jgi:hypothetical protein